MKFQIVVERGLTVEFRRRKSVARTSGRPAASKVFFPKNTYCVAEAAMEGSKMPSAAKRVATSHSIFCSAGYRGRVGNLMLCVPALSVSLKVNSGPFPQLSARKTSLCSSSTSRSDSLGSSFRRSNIIARSPPQCLPPHKHQQ